MSENAIMARFCKCGDLHRLSRRFHSLDYAGKRYALDLIAAGTDPDEAIYAGRRFARRTRRKDFARETRERHEIRAI